ncbi:MAG TPA: ATP-binding protein [Gemmatimonadaceae bacterium]|jgi:hypothetical protein
MARMDLSSIEINTPKNPPRIVVYGDHGIGKTTFATSSPAPIVIRTEKGLAAIRVPAFPIAETFDDVLAAMGTLYQEDTGFQTAIVDTLDWLEPLIWSHACRIHNKANIEDFGYGKGYKIVDEYWRSFLDGLDALNEQKGMTIICLAHMMIKKFNAPDTEPYDRYQMKLHDRAIALVSEWADVVGFAHQEIYTVTQDAGQKKVTRGTGGQRRLLSVEERAAYDAKNRYSLPADLEFPKVGAWQIFADACAPAYAHVEMPALNLVSKFTGEIESDADRRMGGKVEALFGNELREMADDRAADEGARQISLTNAMADSLTDEEVPTGGPI